MKPTMIAHDLLLTLDERRHVIQLLALQRASVPEKLSVLCEIADSDNTTRADLEREIGMAVLAYLSAVHATDAFFLSEYRDAGKSMKEEMAADADAPPKIGGSEEEFDSAMLLIHGFDESWTIDDVDNVTVLLERSSKRGSEQAENYLKNNWPSLSTVFKKRISRKLDR